MKHTFSGTHPFDPTVLVDTDADEQGNADEIIWNIENGRCPRCERPLTTHPGEFPSGSRITQCRSIPICGRCGSDEVYEPHSLGWLSSAAAWPIPVEEIDERKKRYEKLMRLVTLDLTGDGGGCLLTEDGVTPVIIPCNTGGWAQYGDDTECADGDD